MFICLLKYFVYMETIVIYREVKENSYKLIEKGFIRLFGGKNREFFDRFFSRRRSEGFDLR